MNLSNAIKYNHFHGTVNVHCEELSDDGNIAVFQFVCSDTSLGMSEEFQKHAFDAFAQERQTVNYNIQWLRSGTFDCQRYC